jgi:hypothetical protein
LKIAEKIETTNAPNEPFDGCVTEGAADRRIGVDVGAATDLTGEIDGPWKVIDGSSAIMAISRPAQPNWLSTAFGSFPRP